MAAIYSDFSINSPVRKVFPVVSTPGGLDIWWSKKSSGNSGLGEVLDLGFGPGYDWKAKITKVEPNRQFELKMVKADPDWLGTSVGFDLDDRGASTQVHFHHKGWHRQNEHYKISCYCWPMYLRILKRYLEWGETVPYENRLEV